MKLFYRFSVMAAIAGTLAFAGCTDDVYDPERGIQTEPKENPLGEDFAAPDGFNWSMINTVNLNVEVNDEFDGRYKYLIEVFTANPISDVSAAPIAVGTADKDGNYNAEINVSKATARLFIRQTDPKQRKEVYEYDIPENGGALECKLYSVSTGTKTRAASRVTANSNPAAEAARAAGITEIADKEYKEAEVIPAVPGTSDGYISDNPWDEGVLADGAEYIIGKEYTSASPYLVQLRTNRGRATVFVQGVWKLSDNHSNLDIYVMNGGKIIANALTVGNNNTLALQSGGSLECTSLKLGCPTKNFGSIKVGKELSMNLGNRPELFNAGNIEADDEITINGSNVINHGTLSAHEFNFVNARILNKADLTSATDIDLNGSQLFNYGNISFDEADGEIETNNSTATAIVNRYEARISGHEIEGGLSVYNDGFIETSKFTNSSSDVLYNSCTVIVKKEFKFRNVTLNKGSITAGRADETDTEWLPVPEIESQTDAKFTLIDGSMIKAREFEVKRGDVIFQAVNITNNDKSMIKAEKIKFEEPTNVQLLSNNLVIEGKIEGPSQYHPFKKNESVNTGYDESRYTIETCGGIYDEGNKGEEEKDPDFPIEIKDSDVYTFAFEDNWPAYGDFDMNDLVIVMSGKELQVDKNGIVTRLRMTLELRAAGAAKTLGAGVRFTKLSQAMKPDKFRTNGKDVSFENKQSIPTYLLFSDACTELWGSQYTGTEKRINTLENGPFKKDTKEYNIIMELPVSANVKPEDLNINNIDVFAITAPATTKRKRTEVHVAGFTPTDLGGTHYFNSGNDDSSVAENRYYLSKENLAWAVVIPQEFAWPAENRKVTMVYDRFRSWITTGGQRDNDWYQSHNKDVYPIENLTPLNRD